MVPGELSVSYEIALPQVPQKLRSTPAMTHSFVRSVRCRPEIPLDGARTSPRRPKELRSLGGMCRMADNGEQGIPATRYRTALQRQPPSNDAPAMVTVCPRRPPSVRCRRANAQYCNMPCAASRPSNTAVTTRSEPRTMSRRRILWVGRLESGFRRPRHSNAAIAVQRYLLLNKPVRRTRQEAEGDDHGVRLDGLLRVRNDFRYAASARIRGPRRV